MIDRAIIAPDEADLWLAFQAGPAGARLASRWFDAVIAGLPSEPLRDIPDVRCDPKSRPTPRASQQPAKLPATDRRRCGWQWWVLHPDGYLVSPILGAKVAGGNTFDAHCACGSPAAPDCGCGIHYVQRAGDLLRHSAWQYPALQALQDSFWTSALAFGVAVGAVEVDKTRHVDMPSRRTQRWHQLALMAPGLNPERQAALGRRYDCEVIPEVSLEACRAVSKRLEASLSPARMAELARAPAAVLKPPEQGCPLNRGSVAGL